MCRVNVKKTFLLTFSTVIMRDIDVLHKTKGSGFHMECVNLKKIININITEVEFD